MELFIRVVETKSFSAVAKERRIGQPAVSKQTSALEAELGSELLHRNTRPMTLTEAGREFYQSAQRILEDFESGTSRIVRAVVPPPFAHIWSASWRLSLSVIRSLRRDSARREVRLRWLNVVGCSQRYSRAKLNQISLDGLPGRWRDTGISVLKSLCYPASSFWSIETSYRQSPYSACSPFAGTEVGMPAVPA
jgi:hypothetical protein